MLKFMNAAVSPPSGPSTRIPTEPSKRWYFHEPGAGKKRQREATAAGADDAVAVISAPS
jgi:hypothetical protein